MPYDSVVWHTSVGAGLAESRAGLCGAKLIRLQALEWAAFNVKCHVAFIACVAFARLTG